MWPEIGESHSSPVFVTSLLVVVLLIIIVCFLWGGEGALCWGLLYVVELVIGVRPVLFLCLWLSCLMKRGLKPTGDLSNV